MTAFQPQKRFLDGKSGNGDFVFFRPHFFRILWLLAVFFPGQAILAQPQDTLTYVFMGHIYEWGLNGSKVDSRIERMNLKQFDRIWLGGDVCSETSLNYGTLSYLDDLFELRKPGNHWALGNHDTRNGNLEWIEEFTGRPTFYAHHEKGITSIVLDGNISPLDCEKLNAQYRLIQSVCDTIQSGHLIFLVHHGIYEDVPGVANPATYGHSQLKNWMANCHDGEASYLQAIYPLLVNVRQRGVKVMHIMGDVGASAKSYYGISNDGIEYFGSGINNSFNQLNNLPITAPDLLLIFKHLPSTNQLFWEFVELDKL